MNKIHPTAIVSPLAKLGSNNIIGPYVIIEDEVTIGSNNTIGPHAVLMGNTTIGDDNKIHSGAIIGDLPQDLSFKGQESYLIIRNNNQIREHVTIHRGSKHLSKTSIGDNNLFMTASHIAHDCEVKNNVIIASGSLVSGYVKIEDNAFVSGNVVIHQFCRIGKLSMIGGGSRINMDIPPYMSAVGHSASIQTINLVGLRRANISLESRNDIKKAFKYLYRSHLSVSSALELIKNECYSNEVRDLEIFIQNTKRGITKGSKTHKTEPDLCLT
jgi:UDP-N-acetylglucosamine acyltransferase